MPLHDWTRVSDLSFLDQHFVWTLALARALNLELLPPGYFALVQRDPVMVKRRVPPAQRIEIQHAEGRPLIAVVEVVAPAYKVDAATIDVFVRKSVALLKRGVHVAMVDVVPDPVELPGGFLAAITARLKRAVTRHTVSGNESHAALIAGTGAVCSAHSRPYEVGAAMPSLPLYLTTTQCVTLPLEGAYLSAWVSFPKFLRERLEFPASGVA